MFFLHAKLGGMLNCAPFFSFFGLFEKVLPGSQDIGAQLVHLRTVSTQTKFHECTHNGPPLVRRRVRPTHCLKAAHRALEHHNIASDFFLASSKAA